jgi:hypothetical protein
VHRARVKRSGTEVDNQVMRPWRTPVIGRALGGLISLLALGIVAPSPAAAAEPPQIGGCPILPGFKGSSTAPSAANQSAWNQDVSKAPIDSRSRA